VGGVNGNFIFPKRVSFLCGTMQIRKNCNALSKASSLREGGGPSLEQGKGRHPARESDRCAHKTKNQVGTGLRYKEKKKKGHVLKHAREAH